MAGRFRNGASVQRAQATLMVAALIAGVWIGVSAAAAQRERDAEIDGFLSRIPPVIGEFEACLDANPLPGLTLVPEIRQIVLTRLFWRMRERGDALDVIGDRLAVASRQTEQIRQMATRQLREFSADLRKLDGHCEHAAIVVHELLEALR